MAEADAPAPPLTQPSPHVVGRGLGGGGMTRPAVYLDYNATAQVRPVTIAAVGEALASGGNPSSVHAAGRAARARLEAAREAVAKLIAAPASTVIFTSGGTEANAIAIESAVQA